MPDAVSVRQVDGLPRASFRFHLTMDTLASSYALGATPCARDFHPLDYARAAHTYDKIRYHNGEFYIYFAITMENFINALCSTRDTATNY